MMHGNANLVYKIFILQLSIKENPLDTGINENKCFSSLILKIKSSLKKLFNFILNEIIAFVVLNKCLFIVDITGESFYSKTNIRNII